MPQTDWYYALTVEQIEGDVVHYASLVVRPSMLGYPDYLWFMARKLDTLLERAVGHLSRDRSWSVTQHTYAPYEEDDAPQ